MVIPNRNRTAVNHIPIGQFSRTTRLTHKALRLYADNGVLPPAWIDSATGYRYYRADQVERAEIIKCLRGVGMPLQDIRAVLDAGDDASAQVLLARHQHRLELQLQQLAHLRGQLRQAPAAAPQAYAIGLETVPPIRVASLRFTTVLARVRDDLRMAFGAFHAGLLQARAQPSGPPMLIHHDLIDETNDGDVEICVPVLVDATAPSTLHFYTQGGGPVAATTHRGAYEAITPAYHELFRWIAGEGLEPAGPLREIYLNDPAVTPVTERLTRIECPVNGAPLHTPGTATP